MIVIGSHGRSGVSYVAMGSVATAVAHHAGVPVLICRSAGELGGLSPPTVVS